nr:ATP-binding protein [Acidimicrobiia bacterium]
ENAVKYGGPQIEIRSWQEGDVVNVEVRDDGAGVTAHDVERIFEPYEQSAEASVESPTGVGIGLYVSRLLARLMGGSLHCVRHDGWTTFSLVIPAATSSASLGDEARSAAS